MLEPWRPLCPKAGGGGADVWFHTDRPEEGEVAVHSMTKDAHSSTHQEGPWTTLSH